MGGLKLFAVLPVFAAGAIAQIPQIAPNGVVNAASWSAPVSPGSLGAIFGTNLASTQASASPPLPLTLGGASVTINGIPAPLYFVSPGQINLQVPSSIGNLECFEVVSATIVVTTAAGAGAPVTIPLSAASPGLFTADGSGCGQAAALNVRPDGTVSINSPSNSAAPGDYISIFGTGFGLVSVAPPDGTPASGASPLARAAGISVDYNISTTLLYAGLAPGLVGIDQLNFQVPASARNGCSVPIRASGTLAGPAVTISVQNGRGQCADPPIESYGQISLSKWTNSGPGSPVTQESFGAMFPSGPGMQPPAAEKIVFAPDWATGVPGLSAELISDSFGPLPQPRVCPVPGYSHLSAGAIQIQPPNTMAITEQPLPSTTALPTLDRFRWVSLDQAHTRSQAVREASFPCTQRFTWARRFSSKHHSRPEPRFPKASR